MIRTKNLAWARQPWFLAAMVWWAWLVICSLPIPSIGLITGPWRMSFLEAVLILRLIIFTAALQTWLLTTPAARRAAWIILALSVLWIGIESWQQYATGTNIFGNHRWKDGALTGPFWKPRAGQLYAHLLFIALLPVLLPMLARRSTVWRAGGMALVVLAVVTSVLIGQRMGTILTGIGLITAAFFIPKLRPPALIALAAGALFLLATPIISPHTYAKLVGETSHQLKHFALSPYGELFTRATVMGLASPWHGWGYNGFRALCREPQFSGGLPALGIGPTDLKRTACSLHPQNYYIQAFSDAGFPGLILFVIMICIWLRNLARGLWRTPDPLRVGLFICFVTFAWPLASTDEFPTLYMLGWLYYTLGLGLALASIAPHISSNTLKPDTVHA